MTIAVAALVGGAVAGQAQHAEGGEKVQTRAIVYLTAEDMNWG
ncbi:hypothetical protein ACFC58_01575 [Kitasatospora purpeofusca]